MAVRYIDYRCPENGVLVRCDECKVPFPHRREERLPEGRKAPSCETHRIRLVRSN